MVDLILLSLQVAIIATLINIPIAIYVGWLIGRRNIRGKLILETLISLPLALPPVVTGYFLLILVDFDQNEEIWEFSETRFAPINIVFVIPKQFVSFFACRI